MRKSAQFFFENFQNKAHDQSVMTIKVKGFMHFIFNIYPVKNMEQILTYVSSYFYIRSHHIKTYPMIFTTVSCK